VRISLKIALFVMALCGALVASLWGLSVQRESRLLREELQRDVVLVAETLSLSVPVAPGGRGVAESTRLVMEGVQRVEPALAVDWLSADEAAPWLVAATRGQAAVSLVLDDAVGALAPLRDSDGSLVGAFRVTESLEAQRAFRSRGLRSMVLSLVGILLASTFGSLWIGRVLVGRRVDELVHVARRVGEGDFSAPPRPRGADELGTLMRELASMASHLEQSQQRERAAAQSRLAMEEQLRHADRLATLGQLCAGVAHELGTPLSVVAGRAQLVVRRGAPWADDAGVILQQTQRMTAIVQRLLDFARPTPPSFEACPLDAAVQQAFRLVMAQSKSAGVALRVSPGMTPVALRADPTQLGQVLTNLLLNAVHASESGEEVTVSWAVDQSVVHLRIRDVGTGVAPDLVERVFDPFFTTKEPGEGTGLGLSVVHGIVSEHGGHVEVESELGAGTTFVVTLPRAA